MGSEEKTSEGTWGGWSDAEPGLGWWGGEEGLMSFSLQERHAPK